MNLNGLSTFWVPNLPYNLHLGNIYLCYFHFDHHLDLSHLLQWTLDSLCCLVLCVLTLLTRHTY